MRIVVLLTQIFTSLVLLSCNVADSQSEPDSPIMDPVVAGIYITREDNPTEIGVYGNPSTSADWIVDKSINRYQLRITAFPNPFHGNTHLSFFLPTESTVRLTIVRARPQSDNGNQVNNIGGGLFQNTYGSHAIELINGKHNPGYYSTTWHGADKNGKPVPAGFYRAYLQFGNNLIWRDLLVSQSKDDLPPELRGLIWFYNK